MAWLIGIFVFIIVILLFIISRLRIYRKIFSVSHYLEFAEAVVGVKQAAIDAIGNSNAPIQDDPRGFVTSVKVAVLYRIAHRPEGYEHYYSIGMQDRFTPNAVGIGFTFYLAHLLGFDADSLNLGVSDNYVFHTVTVMTPDQHAEFVRRDIKAPTPEEVQRIHSDCLQKALDTRVERIKTE